MGVGYPGPTDIGQTEMQAKDFLKDGKNIARDGLLPLNTNGGQLSGGRTHGFGYFHEAINS